MPFLICREIIYPGTSGIFSAILRSSGTGTTGLSEGMINLSKHRAQCGIVQGTLPLGCGAARPAAGTFPVLVAGGSEPTAAVVEGL